jgi:site-specific recombinase XerD
MLPTAPIDAPAVTVDAPLAPELVERIAQALEAGASANTRRAYRADWHHFAAWCGAQGRRALPAAGETVAAYVVSLEAEGFAVSTVRRRVATISKAHGSQVPDAPNPARSELVRGVVRGIARTRAEGNGKGAAPILPGHVRGMIDRLEGEGVKAARDRALVLFLLASGARRSELVGLTVADLDWSDPRGVVVTITRSKTDQTGEGREVSISRGTHGDTCPVRALIGYLEAAGISSGPVFRSVDKHGNVSDKGMTGAGVSYVVKRAAEISGMNPAQVSPHGFRAGHVSARRAAGEDAAAVMDTTGHRSVAMLRRYDRASRRFRADVSASLGL